MALNPTLALLLMIAAHKPQPPALKFKTGDRVRVKAIYEREVDQLGEITGVTASEITTLYRVNLDSGEELVAIERELEHADG